MIKAGSLFYAIVISLIIAIVSSSLILFSYLTHIQFETFEINQKLQLNADSGLNLLLSKQSLVSLNETKTIDLYEQEVDSVELTRKCWGAYEIAISKAIFKNTSFLRIALLGFNVDDSNIYSLYLSDKKKPLALCGKTKIKGAVFLPKAGVKSAYIEGQNFVGNNLIEGSIKQSDTTLPEFNKDIIEHIQTVFSKRQISENDSIIFLENELSGDSLENSFLNKSLIFKSKNSIRVFEGCYSGNIVIISDKQVTISSTAILHDVLIFSPKVIVEKEFKGNVQIFASDSVIIGKNVALIYPSVIGLVRASQSPNVAAIVLSDNDTVIGNIFIYKKAEDLKQAGLILAEKSLVYGQIYSNGYVDVKGTIYGSIMNDKILLKTATSVYENHLLNVEVDRSKLSKYFVGVNLADGSTIKKVVKWKN